MKSQLCCKKKLIIDADSLFFKICCVTNDFEEACRLFDLKIKSLVSFLESKTGNSWEYQIYFQEKIKNFRLTIDPTYKANRKTQIPPNFNELKRWVKSNYPVKTANGTKETDDLIAEDANENCCICYIDKDLKQIYTAGLHLNYEKMELYKVERKEALKNFYTQMITGDCSDNIKALKGKGIKYAEKLFKNKSCYFYLTLKEYIKHYGTQKGWKVFRTNYKLLRLGNLSFIDY
ncbi:MAG: hypothetical protein NZZ41_02615 [Candidatus Dojkabacteria bacterium]|nr:hypothetical protein [Candidatus Dojkabacteria bacterium]